MGCGTATSKNFQSLLYFTLCNHNYMHTLLDSKNQNLQLIYYVSISATLFNLWTACFAAKANKLERHIVATLKKEKRFYLLAKKAQ